MRSHLLSPLCTLVLLGSSMSVINAQRYMGHSGTVHFHSQTLMEDIEATLPDMTGIMDAVDGSFAFQVKMRSFSFEKALMQEHFNEDYIESDQFPKASFQGQIIGWSESLGDGETHVVQAEGSFWCHGVEQRRTIDGSLKKADDGWEISCRFPVQLEEHDIDVPGWATYLISSTIDVDVQIKLTQQ